MTITQNCAHASWLGLRVCMSIAMAMQASNQASEYGPKHQDRSSSDERARELMHVLLLCLPYDAGSCTRFITVVSGHANHDPSNQITNNLSNVNGCRVHHVYTIHYVAYNKQETRECPALNVLTVYQVSSCWNDQGAPRMPPETIEIRH